MGSALFGRKAELAHISNVLDALPSGPVALLLEGETGIGKTALLNEALSRFRAQSIRVLSCQPNEAEAKLSFAALADLLAGAVDEALPGLPPPQRSALEVALLRAESRGPPPDQRAISAAFHQALLNLAAGSLLILAIDDVQWLDTPSARALEFAIRRLNDVPIGLIFGVRSDELDVLPLGLGRALTDDRVHRLIVGPLTLAATKEMFGSQLSTRFPHLALVRIHEASGGNPFFALELARAILRRGMEHEPGPILPVPSKLADLVRDRLSQLTPSVRHLLLLISAASQPTIPLVTRTMVGPTVEGDIEEAFRAGLIEQSGGRIRFANSLLATVLYSESSGRARRDVHRRLAAAAVDEEERAWHLAFAAEGPDEEVAAALTDAARLARGRGAPDAAARLSELARELTPSDRAIDRMHRMVHAGQYAFEATDLDRAAALLEEAVDSAPTGELRAEALLFLARVRYHSHDALSARKLAEQALDEAGRHPALMAEIQLELAAAAEALGDHPAARAHAQASVELAEGPGNEAILAQGLALSGFYQFIAGEGLPEGLMTRAIALEAAAGELRPVRSPTFYEACMLMWTDELDAARSTFKDLEKRCREGGDEGSLSVMLFLLAQLECWAGDWPASAEYADESCTITGWTGQQPYRALALYAKALVEAYLGRTEVARAALEEGLELARRSGLAQAIQFNQSALGFLELSLGNVKEAHQVLWPLAEGVLNVAVGEPGMLRFLPDEIEVLVGLGEGEKAQDLLQPFLDRAQVLGRAWALATAERCRGLLAASKGDLAGALAALERALESHPSLDEPFELGRTLLAQGQVLRRAKKWRLARDSLGRALRIFERLGAELWASKAGAELARIGGRSPGPVGLTPTEQQLAELVASGLTNRETAHTLFLSVSSVEANLRSIYRKLGVRSRTELARRLSEH